LLRISIVSYSEPASTLMSAVSTLTIAIERAWGFLERTKPELFIVNNNPARIINRKEFDSTGIAQFCNLVIVQGHKNVGYGSAHNLALRASQSKYHLFMNPDIEVSEEAIRVGIRFLDKNPDVGMVTPRGNNEFGDTLYLNKRHPTVFDLFIRGFGKSNLIQRFPKRNAHYEMRDLSQSSPTKGIPLASGCFMLCRTDIVSSIQGFDEKYFLYFEDFDFSRRLRKISEIAYLPSMRVTHYGGGAANKGLRHLLYFAVSGVRYFKKYGWSWY
jgi:GT2 family glycosyltransferase